MNEMYSMGLSIHSLGTVALLGVVFLNLFILITATELKKYKRVMSIFLLPLSASILGAVLFTGMVMMAAKQLDFTLANSVMIVLGVVFIVLEVKRAKSLKYLDPAKEHAFDAYKPYGRTILQIEFVLVLLISLWMWWL